MVGVFFGREASSLSGDELDLLTEKICRHPGLLTYWQEPDTDLKLVGRTLYKQSPVYTLLLTAKGRAPTTFISMKKLSGHCSLLRCPRTPALRAFITLLSIRSTDRPAARFFHSSRLNLRTQSKTQKSLAYQCVGWATH